MLVSTFCIIFSVNANAGFLSNYEVMKHLQMIKDNTHKQQIRGGSLATVTYETLRYLKGTTDSKKQTAPGIKKYLDLLKEFKLTKSEKLMMVNIPPKTELEIQLIVQESEERLSEEDVQKILNITKQCFPLVFE